MSAEETVEFIRFFRTLSETAQISLTVFIEAVTEAEIPLEGETFRALHWWVTSAYQYEETALTPEQAKALVNLAAHGEEGPTLSIFVN